MVKTGFSWLHLAKSGVVLKQDEMVTEWSSEKVEVDKMGCMH